MAQFGSIISAATLRDLAGLDGAIGQAALLTQPGRQGFFVLREGVGPGGDPLQGLFVRAKAGRHWARVWDGLNAKPEWFGAMANINTTAQAAANRQAIEGCFRLCPRTAFEAGTYFVDTTVRFNTSFRQAIGIGASWEGAMSGTRIISKDNAHDAVLIGTYGPQHGANDMEFENLLAGWETPRAPTRTVLGTPVAWHVERNTSCRLHQLSAYNVTMGFFFHGTVYCRVTSCRVYRDAVFGGPNDFFRAMWVSGRPAYTGFAGGNASLYIKQFSAALARPGGGFMPLAQATGVFADGDFADLYLEEIETAGVAFPIVLDGAGGRNEGGHGDVHIRNCVLDQIIGDGVTIRNTSPYARIHIDGGYIQIIDSRQRNKGVWLENGGGYVTLANLQILGNGSDVSSIGIYLKNQPNVAVSDTVVIEGMPFPVTVEKGCARLSLDCAIGSGGLRGMGHAAVTVDGASQSVLRPKVQDQGGRGAWAAGIELLGTAHDRVSVDPTMIDPAAVSPGRKLVIGGRPVAAPGLHTGGGARTQEGTGVNVTGFVT